MHATTAPTEAPPLPVAALRQALLAWYDQARRDLPWRARPGERPDPYAVLVSEVMLQQTTVATVRPRFAAFLERFPDLATLARAPIEDVLHAWQGLGYYRRARTLHACAQAVVARHGGVLPADVAALRALPGIGAYTAAAVGAIAFGLPAVGVDGNVERVLGRLLALPTPLPAGRRAIDAAAASLATPERTSDFAQAVMELGALVCTPRSPACLTCPWQRWCGAAASGVPETYPRRAARPERPVRFATAFLLERSDGAILFRHRPFGGMLGGMAELPSTPWLDTPATPELVATAAPVETVWRPIPGLARHGFSHFEMRFALLRGRSDRLAEGLWVHPDDFATLALPTMTLRLLRHAGFDARRSGPPNVVEVQGPAPWGDRYDIKSLGQAGELWPALHEVAGGTGDPLLLAPTHGLERETGGVAALDLDEQQDPAAPGNQVDLADRAGETACQDAKALEPQQQGRDGLRPSPGPFPVTPAHRSRKAKARR